MVFWTDEILAGSQAGVPAVGKETPLPSGPPVFFLANLLNLERRPIVYFLLF